VVGFGFWAFIVLMLALTVLWIALGIWQIERLQWKDALVAEVTARLDTAPIDLPPLSQWPTVDPDSWDFRPVKATGTLRADETVLVFTSLSDPKGQYSGAGYWVMTPLELASGGTVFVNRGFVPQDHGQQFITGAATPETIPGVALAPEAPGLFTPGPDPAQHIDWVRDPARLAADAHLAGPILGLTIDLPAGPAGSLPQGGETTIDFPNNHLGYALTWFGLALLTPALLAYWIRRQVQPKPKA
jgi:surfeit locus 1 family protein